MYWNFENLKRYILKVNLYIKISDCNYFCELDNLLSFGFFKNIFKVFGFIWGRGGGGDLNMINDCIFGGKI